MTLQIVQISDTHISKDFPARTQDLENCVQTINAMPTQPALVIHTGDVSHDGLSEEYHIAKQQLDKLRSPYFVMAGNRDNRTELLSTFADNSYNLANHEWIQYSVEHLSTRLIMVDTVSTQSNKGLLCEQRMNHLEAMLNADTTKPAVLFLHHPPYEATGIPDPYQYEDWNDVTRLSDLLKRFNNVKTMYCGHVHRYIDGRIADIEASAITCLAGDLRKGDVSEDDRMQPVFKVISL